MLSDNPVYVWIITIVYILTVTVIGPRFMKNRPAYSFPRFLVVYNSVLVVWSTYMFVEVRYLGRHTGKLSRVFNSHKLEALEGFSDRNLSS